VSRPKAKAIGERGSWFASVDGERLPCVHHYWIKGTHHCAPRVSQNSKKDVELVRAIRANHKVIVTTDRVIDEGLGFERTGYVAVFAVENVNWKGGELSFDLKERLVDLQGSKGVVA
jgi:hypothetical protein